MRTGTLTLTPDPQSRDLLIVVPGAYRPVRMEPEYLAGYAAHRQIAIVEEFVRVELDRRRREQILPEGRHDRGWRK